MLKIKCIALRLRFSLLLIFLILGTLLPLSSFADSNSQLRKGKKFQLQLTYPAGESPKVFDNGWVFGARAILRPGTSKEKNISRKIRWSGTGKFQPKKGPESRPQFNKIGGNKIRLRVKHGGRFRTKVYRVKTVDSARYASVGSLVQGICNHPCESTTFFTSGTTIEGSPNVTAGGTPAARDGDTGVHGACCGSNTFYVDGGDPEVLINGKPAARIGERTVHCGGAGIGEIKSAQYETPTPSEEFGIYEVRAANTKFLIIDTEEDVAARKPCTFDGGGWDCTSDIEYSLLSGPYSSPAEAEQALCEGISDSQFWVLTKCKPRYLYSGDWYWGCESSISSAVNTFCKDKAPRDPRL